MIDFSNLMMRSFRAAVAAADPAALIARHLPPPRPGRVLVVGAGKASAAMAAALENGWQGPQTPQGLVVTRHGHGIPTRHIRIVEAGHPIPDLAGMTAARDIVDQVSALGAEDSLIVLLSGGGSSLMSLPLAGVEFPDYQELTRRLLRSGMPITQMNVLRKHLSMTQGGRLAAGTRASCLALIISDVAGDDVSAIASGPCSPDPSTYADALTALREWRVEAPASVLQYLRDGDAGLRTESPKPGDLRFAATETRIIASSRQSLSAAARVFEEAGVPTLVLGDDISGEAAAVAAQQAALVRRIRAAGNPAAAGNAADAGIPSPPIAVISGGECTVTVRGDGRGGRCSEFLLSAFAALEGTPGIFGLACDTDGIDGTEDNAGAMFSPHTYAAAAAIGLDARSHLARNDSYGFFEAVGELVDTGPTRTNVNDYRCLVVT